MSTSQASEADNIDCLNLNKEDWKSYCQSQNISLSRYLNKDNTYDVLEVQSKKYNNNGGFKKDIDSYTSQSSNYQQNPLTKKSIFCMDSYK